MVVMLSLRSGLFLFYQEKRKSPSAAASRNKQKQTSISKPNNQNSGKNDEKSFLPLLL
jgi:hypothetical protein